MSTHPAATATNRVGYWSATAIVALSLGYVITGAVWLIANQRVAAERGLQPGEPFPMVG